MTGPPKPSNSRRVMLPVGIAGFFLLIYFAIFGIRTTRIGSLRRVLAQNIQMGDSVEKVSLFLDSQGLQHSAVIRPEIMMLHGHDYSNQLVVVAVKRYTARALVWKEWVQIVFVFDEDHKLTRFDVIPHYESF